MVSPTADLIAAQDGSQTFLVKQGQIAQELRRLLQLCFSFEFSLQLQSRRHVAGLSGAQAPIVSIARSNLSQTLRLGIEEGNFRKSILAMGQLPAGK